ncbi:MAG: hypothetical protein J2P19_01075 [Pseudonocardia sp.]|nr:hypothetical protein [Pseudonocardia sp.]
MTALGGTGDAGWGPVPLAGFPPADRPVRVRGVPGPGGGYATYLEAPPEYRGTSVQVCGLWPHVLGVGTPMVGVPIGYHLRTRASVCCDPIHWFSAGIIRNPGMWLFGLTSYGKSTLARQMALGLAGTGVRPIALGDLRPDYREVTELLGGQVTALGDGAGRLNVLDAGAMLEAAAELTRNGYRDAAQRLRERALSRRLVLLGGHLSISRGHALADTEEALLRVGLDLLDRGFDGIPVTGDLIKVISEGPQRLREVTLTVNEPDSAYHDAVRPLLRSLVAYDTGTFGASFGRQSTTRPDVGAPAICVDVSHVNRSDERFLASVLLATWASGWGAIEAHRALAEHGLRKPARYLVIMDELWSVLRASGGMVERVDELTRLNRGGADVAAVGNILITHTFKDADSLPSPEDRAKAIGFAERSGLIACTALAQRDLEVLNQIVGLSEAEIAEVRSWSQEAIYDNRHQQLRGGSGVGKFLLKPGSRPGIPVRVRMPQMPELADLHNTNRQWD